MLELDDGTRLREGPAIVQYIADQAPTKNLAPANGTLPRYRLQEWLTFIGTEMHKGFSPLFNPTMPEEAKTIAQRQARKSRFDWLDGQLDGQGVPDGRALQRGRRLPVHRDQLGQADRRRPRAPTPTCWPGMHASAHARPCRKRMKAEGQSA